MEELKEDNLVSILDVIKILFKRKLLFLIITVAVTIIGTLAIIFGFNKMTQNYEVSFCYSDPLLSNGKYLDGTSFNYYSLITKNNLNKIKESNELYSSINIDKMLDSNAITIVEEETENNNLLVKNQFYKISTKLKYFTDEAQARRFLIDVINIPNNKNLTFISDSSYSSELDLYDNEIALDKKINHLKKEYDYLIELFDTLIINYNDLIIEKYSKSISDIKKDFEMYYSKSDTSLDLLEARLYNNIYVIDYDLNEEEYESIYLNYVNLKKSNDALINEYQIILDNLADSLSSSHNEAQEALIKSYNNKIVKLTLENSRLENSITYYENLLDINSSDPNHKDRATNDESKKYSKELDLAKDSLKDYSNKFKNIYVSIIDENNEIFYKNGSIVIKSGGIKTVFAVLISFALGVIASCCVIAIIDRKKIKELYNKENIVIENNLNNKE